jgi:hypothetical protein
MSTRSVDEHSERSGARARFNESIPGTFPHVYGFLLTVAVILAVLGIVALSRGRYVLAAGLFVAGLLVGPGGVSIFR